MFSIKRWMPFMLSIIVGASLAMGQTNIVNQGKPGQYGAWPVAIPGTISATTVPTTCGTPTQKDVTVGTTAVTCPGTQLTARKIIVFCNSVENVGNPLIKIRIDGVAPIMGLGNPGHTLSPGDCIQYAIGATVAPQCISDTAGTDLRTTECN